jgi:tetratricopeptide (TPR) repeat protein
VESPDRRTTRTLALVLLLAVAAAYSGTYRLGFTTLDDPSYVTKNPHIADGLSREAIAWAFRSHHSANWHPLTWISHMLDVEVYGLRPAGHHLTSVALHIVNTLLLFVVLLVMTGCVWRSAFVAAVFGLHPLHVESVAWVSERKDVLSTLFWMLVMLAYVRYVRGRGGDRPLRKYTRGWDGDRSLRGAFAAYALMIVLYALGLMAKPMLVTLPVVLMLLDWWPLGRYAGHSPSPQPSHAMGEGEGKGTSPQPSPGRRGSSAPSTLNHQPSTSGSGLSALHSPLSALREKLPLFVLAAASCVVTFWAQHSGGAIRSMEQYPLGVRAANAVVAYVAYIGKTLWPARLSALYPHPGDSLPLWQIAVCGAALTAITYVVVRVGRARPYLAVGWFWYLVTLIPVIGLVQVGQQAMADRYTYVPMIGLLLMAAWGVPDALSRLGDVSRLAKAVSAVLVLAALSVATWLQVGHWRDGVTLLKHALASTSGHPMVHYCLADAYLEQNDARNAAEHYRQAIRKKPDFAEAHNGLGRVMLTQGRTADAAQEFRAALRINPRLSSAHNNIGHILLMEGRTREARRRFARAVELDPNNAEAHANLGTALDRLGMPEKAASHYSAALRANPELAEARCGLGSVLLRQGKADEAEKELSEALRAKPDLAEAHFLLANILATRGDIGKATSHLSEAVRIRPTWGPAHYSLAVMLYSTRDYARAWKEVRKAREHGYEPHPGFIEALRQRMPEPGNEDQK